MATIKSNTELLEVFLNKNDFKFTIDNNPSPEKLSRIQVALSRKKNLMELAVTTYKQVFGVK